MPIPERPNAVTPLPQTDLKAALDDINRQLELNDDNENTIERFSKRDQLLEEKDKLQDEIDDPRSPHNNHYLTSI